MRVSFGSHRRVSTNPACDLGAARSPAAEGSAAAATQGAVGQLGGAVPDQTAWQPAPCLAELEVHSVSRATLHLCRWDLCRMFVSGSAAVWCHRCRIRGRRNGARRPAAGRALLAAFRRSPSRLRRLGLRSRSLALAPGATEAIGTTRRGGGPGTRAETGPAPQVRSRADGRNPADHLSGSPARDHAAAIAAIRAQLDGGPLATGRVETRCRAGGAIPMHGWR